MSVSISDINSTGDAIEWFENNLEHLERIEEVVTNEDNEKICGYYAGNDQNPYEVLARFLERLADNYHNDGWLNAYLVFDNWPKKEK